MVKIGMTLDDPESRAHELSSVTGVPTPFCVMISKRIVRPYEKEQAIHDLLSALGFRVNEKREFFNCPLNIVGLLFTVVDGTEETFQDTASLPVVKKQNVKVEKLG